MAWWDDKAARVQESVRDGEQAAAEGSFPDSLGPYSREGVRRAIVHTREDVTMIIVHLSSLNRQISTVKWLLVGILVVAGYIALRMAGRL